MNALRQIMITDTGKLVIDIPVAYQKKRLEVIILSVDTEDDSPKNAIRLAEAHRMIDLGTDIQNPTLFLSDFENSHSDRSLPFRD